MSTHVLSGALLGHALRRPVTTLGVGVVSHLVLDALPHWGSGAGWPPGPMDDEMYTVARLDGLAGLGLIAAVAAVTPARTRLPVLAGIVGACLPDLDKPGRLWLGRSPWPERFDKIHAGVQVRSEKPHRLPQDVAIACVAAVLTLAVVRRG